MPRTIDRQPVAIMNATAALFHWQQEQQRKLEERVAAYREALRARMREAATSGVSPAQIADVLDIPVEDVLEALGLPSGAGVSGKAAGLWF